MAATAAASSSICNRIYNLSLTPPSVSNTCCNLRQIFISYKPLHLKSQLLNSNTLTVTAPLSLYHLCLASAAFDGFEVAQDTQQEDPDAETFEEREEQEEEQRISDPSEPGSLYVGNLPFSITSFQLAEVFREAGDVVSVEIVYDRITDRSRGFAFVTMGSGEDAKEAIRMFDGSQIGGRTVKVNFPEVPRGGERLVMVAKIRNNYKGFVDSLHKIYAGNLGWELTSQGLREAFADQPGLLSAKVIYERDTGKSRGFGFVSFDTTEHLESALNAMNGVEVQGRPLRLSLAAERSAASPQPQQIEEIAKNGGVDPSELLSSLST